MVLSFVFETSSVSSSGSSPPSDSICPPNPIFFNLGCFPKSTSYKNSFFSKLTSSRLDSVFNETACNKLLFFNVSELMFGGMSLKLDNAVEFNSTFEHAFGILLVSSEFICEPPAVNSTMREFSHQVLLGNGISFEISFTLKLASLVSDFKAFIFCNGDSVFFCNLNLGGDDSSKFKFKSPVTKDKSIGNIAFEFNSVSSSVKTTSAEDNGFPTKFISSAFGALKLFKLLSPTFKTFTFSNTLKSPSVKRL